MSIKKIPDSFDKIILQDHLFRTLQRSKQTKHLVNLRAQQIIKEILFDFVQTQTFRKYREVQQNLQKNLVKFQKVQKQKQRLAQKAERSKQDLIQELKLQKQGILNQVQEELQLKDEEIINLQSQISQLTQKYQLLKQQHQKIVQQKQKMQNNLDLIRKQNQLLKAKTKQLQKTLSMSQSQTQKILFSHQQQKEKNFIRQKNYQENIKKLQQDINKFIQENQILKVQLKQNERFLQKNQKQKQHQSKLELKSKQKQQQLKQAYFKIQKLKKQLKQSDENYQKIKKQITKFRQKYYKFQEQYKLMKESNQKQLISRNQIINQQKIDLQNKNIQIRDLIRKNSQFQQKNNQVQAQSIILKDNFTKLKNNWFKISKTLLISLNQLKSQNLILKNYALQKIKILKQYSQGAITKVVNHISNQLSEYFQQCVFQIKKARQQKYLAKQQAKIKNQIIQHLDKLLNNQSKSVYQLKNQLRVKRKQQEKLRKKLKYHYEQTDKKLQNFQKKYISILKEQT